MCPESLPNPDTVAAVFQPSDAERHTGREGGHNGDNGPLAASESQMVAIKLDWG